MDAATFARTHLRDSRLLVAFVAPPDWPNNRLDVWPATWVRADDGTWHPLEFGRSHRARQLLTLLAVHPEGLNGPTASRFFDKTADANESLDVRGGTRDERAKSALGTLRAKLGGNGFADVSALLEVPPGHRRSRPWRLHAVTTDVQIASDAVDAGQWDLAWLLLHGGGGRLVGVPRTRPSSRRRTPPHLRIGSSEREAIRTGVLPPVLIDAAAKATAAVISHFEHSAETPPIVVPGIVPEMLRAAGSSADLAKMPSDTSVPGAGIRHLPATKRDAVSLEVRPLMVPARRPERRSGVSIVVSLSIALPCALAVALIIMTTGSRGRSLRGPTSPLVTATGARLEVQTYVAEANTFADPHDLDGPIVKLRAGATVLVTCREFVPGPRSFAPYWWYRLQSPLSGRWVPANSFLNGDPAVDYLGVHPHPPRDQHSVDTAVPVCGPGTPGGTVATPIAAHVVTFARYQTGSDAGPAIVDRRRVVVSCKVESTAAAAEPGGYAYRVASAPWSGRFYAPARAFGNSIPADTGAPELVDPEVPSCPA